MEKLFQVQGQTVFINEEDIRTIYPSVNLQCVGITSGHNQFQVVGTENIFENKEGVIQEAAVVYQPQQCIQEAVAVSGTSRVDHQQVAIVSAGQILPVALHTAQVQQVIINTPVANTPHFSALPVAKFITHQTTPPKIQSVPNEQNGVLVSTIVNNVDKSTENVGEGKVIIKDSGKIAKFNLEEEKRIAFTSVTPDGQYTLPNSDVCEIIVVTPGGKETTLIINKPSQKTIDIRNILKQVCRQVGINDTMEAVIPKISERVTFSPSAVIRKSELTKKENRDTSCTEDSIKDGESQELPIYIPGKLAVCQQCGYLSQDFNKCQRCRRKLPQNVRAVPVNQSTMENKKEQLAQIEIKKEKKKCVRRGKKPEEPVCLTISSDEEDNTTPNNTSTIEPKEEQKVETTAKSTVKEKEPVITESTESPEDSITLGVAGGGVDITELLDSPDIENALLQCRTVRIGSYKVVPIDKVLLSEYGIKIQVPSIQGDPTTIKIGRHEIIKVLVHFGRQLPVLFYYITAAAGGKINNALQMPNKENMTYFDPTSSEEMHKRITLLPDKITEETRLFIKSIYEPKSLLGELTSSEANDILVRAAPKDVQHHLKKETVQGSSCHPIQTIMVYPPPPTKGGISINTEDYACLGEDQFLNDVIIDFYLKYLLQTMLSEEDQKRTHVFSSFFYKRLTTRTTPQVGLGAKNIEDPKLSPAEKRHARVKGWTKSVDLFAKDFIIIPINENSHWFLGIICFPGLLGPVRMSDNTPVETVDKPNATKEKSASKDEKGNEVGTVLTGGAAPATIGATTITMVQSTTITLEPDDEDRDEAEGDDEDLEPNSSEDEGPADSAEGELLDEATHKAVKPPKPPQEPIKQPCILIFDSLAGASRSRVCATLRDYLRVEYKLRHKKSDRTFSKDILKGAVPKVPQQTNFTDCGLYVLQYVESFFQKPITDYRMPIKMLRDWFTADIVSRKRYEIQQLLHKLMEEQNIDVMRLNLPFLGLKEDGQHSMEYDENEEEDEEGLEDEEEEDVDLGLEEEEQEEEEDLGLDRERALNIEERMQMEMEEEDEGDYDSEELNDNVSRTSELFCENSPLKRKQTVSLKEVHNQRAMNSSMSPPRDCKKMRCDD